MRPRIVLFDIDGTLINCVAGRQAMRAAFAEIGAGPDALAFRFGGMTDRAIVRRGLERAGGDADQRQIDALIERYLAHLSTALASDAAYRVLPGAGLLLERLARVSGLALGLGTGNVERGARKKLGHARLDRHFAFGGFGCDHELRPELLRAGAQRGAARLERRLDDCDVIVVGDTPHDVSAAHAIGARCVAVSTGGYSSAELAAGSPELVVDDLSDPRASALLQPS